MRALFASDSWRVTAALTVLGVLVVACLAGSNSNVSAAPPHSPPSRPSGRSVQQPGNVPRKASPLNKPISLVALSPAEVLLTRIHAEEHAAQQIDRQLAPLHQEIEAMQASIAVGSPSAIAALQDKVDIYERLRQKQQIVVSQWKQDLRAHNQLVAHPGAVRVTSDTLQSTKESE